MGGITKPSRCRSFETSTLISCPLHISRKYFLFHLSIVLWGAGMSQCPVHPLIESLCFCTGNMTCPVSSPLTVFVSSTSWLTFFVQAAPWSSWPPCHPVSYAPSDHILGYMWSACCGWLFDYHCLSFQSPGFPWMNRLWNSRVLQFILFSPIFNFLQCCRTYFTIYGCV